jgi:hypothetical protein
LKTQELGIIVLENVYRQHDNALAQLNQVQGEKERVEKSLEERRTQFSLFMTSIVELKQLLQVRLVVPLQNGMSGTISCSFFVLE